MPSGQGPTHRLALWFWEEILGREDSFWESPGFPRYLSEAKRARKTLKLDVEILKQSLLDMKAEGIKVSSILLPTLWAHHTNGPNWYEYTEKRIKTPPPIYEVHAFRAWCIANGHDDLLEMLNDGIS
jgi:hypothetical protein